MGSKQKLFPPRESPEELRVRAGEILRRLLLEFPHPKTALRHQSPFQLLVATILSAQCTDERVNMVTPGLFSKYPDAQAFAKADQQELEREIHSTGFFRMKARNIIACSRALSETHAGRVPEEMELLVGLPGVGRKTANVVLGQAFGTAAGVVVDTHVQRLSGRLALSREKTPEKVERDLMKVFPPSEWIDLASVLILHGRRTCMARNPDCPRCGLRDVCPSAEVFMQAALR